MTYTRKTPLSPRPIIRAHSEETRQRIRAIKLIERLQTFALSTEQDGLYTGHDGNPVHPMTALQVRVSLALLNKVLPDMQTVAVATDETRTYVIRAPLPAKDHEEWMRLYGPPARDQTS